VRQADTVSAAPETRLVLIRHGESRAQEEGFFSGHDTCTGLSERGRRQAEALRDRLLGSGELAPVDALYTSILPRAIETAAIISAGVGGAEPVQECDWCEIHAGEAEGLPYEEARSRWPFDTATDSPFHSRIPGCETWAEFYVRAGARLQRVLHDHPGERVVVVCHGGIIGASFIALGDLPIRHGSALTHETVNTSITEWRWNGRDWRLVRYNDAAHLAAAEPR
jgi:probable phosphoglycerate mutase